MPKAQDKDHKGEKRKDLVVRVKKAVKKSQKRLKEERFRKELTRSILFLEKLLAKINETQAKAAPKAEPKPAPPSRRRRRGKK
jgi:hypothetical protein